MLFHSTACAALATKRLTISTFAQLPSVVALIALLLFLLLSPRTALAQQPDRFSSHWFPGAVELLDKGDLDTFPDAPDARRWLYYFWFSMINSDICGEEWLYQNVYRMKTGLDYQGTTAEGALVASAISKIQFGYLAGALGSRMIAEGIETLRTGKISTVQEAAAVDAVLLVRERGCDDVRHISRNAASVMYRLSDRRANPDSRLRFFSMAAPHVLKSAGIDPKSVERFKPGYVSPETLWRQQIEAKVKPNLSESELGLQPESLHGKWAGTVELPGEYEYDGEERRKVVVSFWHSRGEELARIWTGFAYEQYVKTGPGEVLPAVMYRGDSRVEVSEGWGSDKRLLVGELSDDATKIVGRIAHDKWRKPSDTQSFEGYEHEGVDVEIVLTKVK